MSKNVYIKIALGFALGAIAGYFFKDFKDKAKTKPEPVKEVAP